MKRNSVMTPMTEDEYNKIKSPSKEFLDSLQSVHNLFNQKNKCKYYDTCPSCSGWCNNKQPDSLCVDFILTAYDNLNNKYNDMIEDCHAIIYDSCD